MMFGMMIDTGPKFYRYHPLVPYMNHKVMVMDLEFLCESFTLKCFRKEKRNSGALSCPAKSLIYIVIGKALNARHSVFLNLKKHPNRDLSQLMRLWYLSHRRPAKSLQSLRCSHT